jgi:hypothetical protein
MHLAPAARSLMPESINARPSPNTPAEQWLARGAALAPEELDCIKHAVYTDLDLPESTPLTTQAFVRATFLYLSYEQISDAGLAWLSAKDSPLTSLTTLFLSTTKVTDQGLVALAAKDSPLTALIELYLNETLVTDNGTAALKQRFPNIKMTK